MKNGGSFHSYVNVYQRVPSITRFHLCMAYLQGVLCGSDTLQRCTERRAARLPV